MTAIGIFFKGSGDERRLKGKSMKKAVSFCVLAALALAGCAGDLGLTENHKSFRPRRPMPHTAAALISAYRTSRGLSPVTVDSRLNEAAEYQARGRGSGRKAQPRQLQQPHG